MRNPELIFLVEEDPDGGFTAKAVGESIFTQAETLQELKQNIKDALLCHFDRKEDIPAFIRLHIVHEETLTYA
ncbi:MAG: 2-oxoisovalerate dehydrogenase [Candidatus Omnitrophica bacterium]|nr:2-oxoisovalerate dehydrogenase [Candidatus Omnitrophota bacterium]